MKQKYSRAFRLVGKTSLLLLILLCGSLLFVSYKTKKYSDDLWAQLGLSKEAGTSKIKQSFFYGYLQYYGARNMKKIATGDRVTVAKQLLAYTRQYLESDAFKKEYEQYRSQAKPRMPEPAKTEAEIRKERIESTRRSIEQLEKGLKTAKEEYKKMYEENIERQKKQLKEFDDPNNKMIQLQVKGAQSNYEYKMKQYEAQMKEWEQKTPENPMGMVKYRLQQMLDATKDVDFSAQLVEKDGKKVFVNPAYERKDNNWKYAFRAGKDVTETVRAFAQKWISEMK